MASHPLHQIAESPTHNLLLKQWVKEEQLIALRVASKHAQLHSLHRELTFLTTTFFLFHSILLLFLLRSPSPSACHRAWVPSLLSLLSSLIIVFGIWHRMGAERRLRRLVEREEEDGVLMGRCVGELKRKGLEFDLLREVDALRRAKSLRVEVRGKEGKGRWDSRDFVVGFFVVAACGMVVLVRLVLCQ